MGYKGKAGVHGFQAKASTIRNEEGFNPDAIERQLSHVETNMVRAAYNRAEYMEESQDDGVVYWMLACTHLRNLKSRRDAPSSNYKKTF